MICSVCSNKLDPGDRFCNLCGMPVKEVFTQKPATPQSRMQKSAPTLCRNCGAKLPADALFCKNCHAVVKKDAVPSVTKPHCRNCGAALKTGERFCGYCGTKV